MEITAVLGYLEKTPSSGFSLVLVLIALLISFFFKRKDIDISQVTSISKLQAEQLAILIEQNKELAKELHSVRQELSEAYKVIDNMRNRLTELEEMLRIKPPTKE